MRAVLPEGSAAFRLVTVDGLISDDSVKTFVIDNQVPAANIVLERREGREVYLRPDLRDSVEWWFYFSFRVAGAAGQTLRFHFLGRDPMTRLGPAVSSDGGRTWRWLGTGRQECLPHQGEGSGFVVQGSGGGSEVGEQVSASFEYRFAEDEDEVRFAVGLPYVRADLERFLCARPWVRREKLCRSPRGREVEALYLGGEGSGFGVQGSGPDSSVLNPEPRTLNPAQARLLVTARHHCCESSASYVLEGVIDGLRAGAHGGAFDVRIVPMVDLDGVEEGDQGKHRRGRDHNRDYGEPSVYPETEAIKRMVKSWKGSGFGVQGSGDGPLIALDLHCPFVNDGGTNTDRIHFVGSRDARMAKLQRELAGVLARRCVDGLRFMEDDILPYGTAWNVGNNESGMMSCARWMRECGGAYWATTLEIPYAVVHGEPVTAEGLRQFGRRLGNALSEWISSTNSHESSRMDGVIPCGKTT